MIKMHRWIVTSFILALAFGSAGCVVLALGAGAAGGYAIGKDEIEGFSDKSFERTWQSAWKIINAEGMVELANQESGRIEAVVQESKVNVEIDQVSPKSVRLRVKARKTMNLFPDIKLAQNLYEQIMKELK